MKFINLLQLFSHLRVSFLALLLINSAVYAGQEGNGGSSVEVQKVAAKEMIINNLLKIEKFFRTNETARNEFPEVSSKDLTKIIFELISKKKIKFVSDNEKRKIFDRYKIARTAVNYPSKKTIVYDLEEVLKLKEKPVVLFVLNFHELLGLLELEFNDPNEEDLSLNYKISGRLAPFVIKTTHYDLRITSRLQTFKPRYLNGRRMLDGVTADRAYIYTVSGVCSKIIKYNQAEENIEFYIKKKIICDGKTFYLVLLYTGGFVILEESDVLLFD